MGKESTLEKHICDWAEERGWEVIKVGMNGWPDRLFISPLGRHVWIEFKKSEETGPSKRQNYRLRILRRRFVAAYWCGTKDYAKEVLMRHE